MSTLILQQFEYAAYFQQHLVDNPSLCRPPLHANGHIAGCYLCYNACFMCTAVVTFPCTRGILRAYAKGNYDYVKCWVCPPKREACTPTWECVRIGGNLYNPDSYCKYSDIYDTDSEEEAEAEAEADDGDDDNIERKFLLTPALMVTSGGLDSKILRMAGEKRARFYANRNFYCCCCYCIPCHSNLLVQQLRYMHFEKAMQMDEECLMKSI